MLNIEISRLWLQARETTDERREEEGGREGSVKIWIRFGVEFDWTVNNGNPWGVEPTTSVQ